MEIFVNRVWATLAAGIIDTDTAAALTTGQGARFGAIPAGDQIRCVMIDSSGAITEVVYITAIAGDNITLSRGQDGTVAVAHGAGDRMEARIGKSTMDALTQKASAGSDAIAETHLSAVKAILVAADEIPLWDSVTQKLSKITYQDLLDELFPAGKIIEAGTRMVFNQTNAPTGWTKDTNPALDDSIMRIVVGVVGSGGSEAFSTFAAQAAAGSYTLTTADMPAHSHGVSDPGHSHTTSIPPSTGTGTQHSLYGNATGTAVVFTSSAKATGISIQNTGGGGAHSHALNNDIKYNDFIIAVKN